MRIEILPAGLCFWSFFIAPGAAKAPAADAGFVGGPLCAHAILSSELYEMKIAVFRAIFTKTEKLFYLTKRVISAIIAIAAVT
jgi:hypothetical protein